LARFDLTSFEKFSGEFFAMIRIAATLAIATLCFGTQAQSANAPLPNFAPDPVTSWFFDREDGDNPPPPKAGPAR
jgi:hypothetical protein